MQRFEYKVVPAPRRGEKARGVKSTEERFALALSTVMNELGAEGWDYVRADSLPCDERSGLTGTKTISQNMLVFRREIVAEAPRAPLFTRPAASAAAVIPAEPALAPAAPEGVTVATPVLHAQPREVNSAPSLGPARPELAAE